MKFKVSVDYIEHYQELEIEADNAEEAKEKYLEKVEYGDVLSVKGDYLNLKAEKAKAPRGYKCSDCGKHKTFYKMVDTDGTNLVETLICDACGHREIR